mgnify:CR=1 FL=1
MKKYVDNLKAQIEILKTKNLSQSEKHEVVTLWTESLMLDETKGREYHFYKRLSGAITKLNSLLARKGLPTAEFPPPYDPKSRAEAVSEILGE